jgi:integrase
MGRVRKHRSAAHFLPAGLSVAYLQIHMRHRDPKSTLTYTHVSDIEAAEVASNLWEKVRL